MPAEKALPLDRIVHLAEFRARLRAFLRTTEHIAATWELKPKRYLIRAFAELSETFRISTRRRHRSLQRRSGE